MHSTVVKPALLRWVGVDLRRDENGLLADPHGQSRVDDNGHVQTLHKGRLDIAAASRFGTGAPQAWVLDTRTGLSVAWRGIWHVDISVGDAAALIMFDDLTVMMFAGPRPVRTPPRRSWERPQPAGIPTGWLATTGPLEHGQITLDARPPKILARRIRRARAAGARPVGRSYLLLCQPPQPGEWPPPERDRTKRGKPSARPWDKPVPRGVHDERDARRLDRRYSQR